MRSYPLTNSASPSKAPAVAHAAAVLRYLASDDRPRGLAQIARSVSVSPSSCLNILRTLVADDLLTFDAEEKTYTLGNGLVRLARRALDPHNTFKGAKTILQALARDAQVTAALWRISDRERITLLGFEVSERDMHLHMAIGQRFPLLSGAVGRLIAACSDMGDAKRQALFKKVRWETAPDFEQYLAELGDVARRGWSVDAGHFRRGVTTVAAGVGEVRGHIGELAVTASLLGVDYASDEVEQVANHVRSAATKIAVIEGASA